MVDLHIHSTASDGTDAPSVLVRKARAAGIDTLALTDHDTVAGVREFLAAAEEGMTLIPGIEVSSRTASGKCHILGLGVRTEDPAFTSLLAEAAKLRRTKLETRLDYLRRHGYELPEAALDALRAMPSAGKPHLGALLARCGYAPDRNSAIRELIDPCPTPSDRVEAGRAVAAIRSAGGAAVWAHPMGEEGKRTLTPEEFRKMLRELLDAGITGMECWYSKYPAEQCLRLEQEAHSHGLQVSGGSDYHGKNKSVSLGQLNAESAEVPKKNVTVLQELTERYTSQPHPTSTAPPIA